MNDDVLSNWKKFPIASTLEKKYKVFQSLQDYPCLIFAQGTLEHNEVLNLVILMLESLTWNNEVGLTVKGRPDAEEVINVLTGVLKGNTPWNNASWVTDNFLFEVYKNEVYLRHNISSAICYSVDLISYRLGAYAFELERFHISTDKGVLKGKRDGVFVIQENTIKFDPVGNNLEGSHLHPH